MQQTNYDAEGRVPYSFVHFTIQCDTGSKNPRSQRSYFLILKDLGSLIPLQHQVLTLQVHITLILIKTVIQKIWGKGKGG